MKRCTWIVACLIGISVCATSGESKGQFTATLPDGTIIELVGLRPYGGGNPQRTRDKSGPWWRPDGTQLTIPPDERVDSCSWSDSYLLVITLEDKDDCICKAVGPWDSDLTVQPTREIYKGQGFANKDLRRFTLRFGNQKSADIRLGVTAGDWKVADRWSIKSDWTPYSLILSSVDQLVLRCPEQVGSDVVAEVTQVITERATRLVLFDQDGNQYESEGQIKGEGIGLVRRVHRFKNLDRKNIEHIEFQVKPYDYWITFSNVSLQVGHKTQVKVDIKQPGALLKGETIPGFDDIELDFVAEDNEGRMLLICFFDMNQRPSRNCIMQLAKKAEQLKHKGLTIIAVQSSKFDGNALNEWVKKYNIPFSVGIVKGAVEKTRFTWGVKSLPWMILTDKNHVVADKGFNINELDGKIKTITEK